jgi:tRNA A37 threonylcarbamoyladenosine dehydratase
MSKLVRLERIIGTSNVELLSKKCVLVLGVGGVGGYVVESLARSGIGKIIIVDFDNVDESNINRQIIALESTVGLKKVDVLESRIKDINPNCEVIKIDYFIDQNNFNILFSEHIDFFVDACDTISVKKMVISKCISDSIPFITCMGTGNKLDPSKLEITDIRNTKNDPIARILRKYVKDSKINKKVLVCTSTELPIKTNTRTPGSSAFVPSSAGLLIGSYIIRYFIKEKEID